MTLTVATVLALAAQCAPGVAPETLLSVVQVESRFEPLAVGVNVTPRVAVVGTNTADAAAKARAHIAAGRSVDLGLAQINSRNLAWLGLTVEQALEPCANLAAAARILSDGYARGDAARVGVQAALQTALSYYNTGHPQRGLTNGYVAKVARAAERFIPALVAANPTAAVTLADPPPPPAWDVFGRSATASARFVLTPASSPVGAAQ